MNNTTNMPSKIPVARLENEHTQFMGKASDGKQFWGYTTYTQSGADSRDAYVVLHTFNQDGAYITTKHYNGGSTSEMDMLDMFSQLEGWLTELGTIDFSDINITPFQTSIDGVVFGLVPNHLTGSLDLQPIASISFAEPWNGQYKM